jgi:hypothetical protein
MRQHSPEGRALGFRIHAFAFVATMLLLAAINYWTGPPYWVLWVLLSWSIGLFCHWWFVVGPGMRGNAHTISGQPPTHSHKRGPNEEQTQ